MLTIKTYREIENELIEKHKETLAKLDNEVKEQITVLNIEEKNTPENRKSFHKAKDDYIRAVIIRNTAITEEFKYELKKEYLPNESIGVANLVFEMASDLADSNDRVTGYYQDLVDFITDLRTIDQIDQEKNK